MSQELNFSRALGDLDGGIFHRQITAALQQVALSALESQKIGEITIKLKIKPINESGAVHVESSFATVQPRPKGRIRQEHVSITPMYSTKTGNLTASPETQDDIFEPKTGNVAEFRKG